MTPNMERNYTFFAKASAFEQSPLVKFPGCVPTVDGRNPAPPGMYKTLMNNGIFTISTGAGFLNHQPYHLCSVKFQIS